MVVTKYTLDQFVLICDDLAESFCCCAAFGQWRSRSLGLLGQTHAMDACALSRFLGTVVCSSFSTTALSGRANAADLKGVGGWVHEELIATHTLQVSFRVNHSQRAQLREKLIKCAVGRVAADLAPLRKYWHKLT